MPIQKACKQCQAGFIIADDDLAFYKKISPAFGEKTYEIPPPTLCPDCRMLRRMSWRNERNLYKRKCSLCQKEIVSLYSPDKQFNVLCQNCFWSDKNNAANSALEYDLSKTFFKQFAQLQKTAPRIALLSKNSENSEYTNHAGDNKDCYLTFIIFNCENVLYSRKVFNSKDIIDSSFIFSSERLSNCFWVKNGYNCSYTILSDDISDCNYCVDLKGCHNCFLSSNLRNKEYYFRNQPLEKAEYELKVSGLLNGSYKIALALKEEFGNVRKEAIYKYLEIINCENCTGDYLDSCKDCHSCYSSTYVENLRYCFEADNSGRGIGCKDCMDSYGFGGCELNYEIQAQAYGYHNLVNNFSYDVRESMYLDNCHNSQYCFGCIGIKGKEYCILNKQYSKAEYEKLIPKIIERMITDGEWGEFFPTSLSPFSYNETVANTYFPKEKADAAKIGAKWLETDYSLKYDGLFYEPRDNIADYKNSEEERQKILSGVLKCEKTGRSYKITPQELSLYIILNIPIPREHYEERLKERTSIMNKMKFYHRQCMCNKADHGHGRRCEAEFETTHSPDGPERVYCEKCYQKSVI